MDASSMRQNSSAPSGIQNTLELNLFKSQQISQQPPKRTKRFQNFQSVGGTDMIATNRSGIEFFAPEYNKDKQHKKDQQEDKRNLVQSNGIKNYKERGVEIEKIKKYEEKFLESRDFENEEDEEFWNGISALKTTKYGIATVR
uniref:Uncharacterized protein n=1 Tax=Meloidogyne javanica TaxID=6303 RepID=A0A915MGF5_MELJA